MGARVTVEPTRCFFFAARGAHPSLATVASHPPPDTWSPTALTLGPVTSSLPFAVPGAGQSFCTSRRAHRVSVRACACLHRRRRRSSGTTANGGVSTRSRACAPLLSVGCHTLSACSIEYWPPAAHRPTPTPTPPTPTPLSQLVPWPSPTESQAALRMLLAQLPAARPLAALRLQLRRPPPPPPAVAARAPAAARSARVAAAATSLTASGRWRSARSGGGGSGGAAPAPTSHTTTRLGASSWALHLAPLVRKSVLSSAGTRPRSTPCLSGWRLHRPRPRPVPPVPHGSATASDSHATAAPHPTGRRGWCFSGVPAPPI